MLKIRRPVGRLIFNMGITIPSKTVFLIETAPCAPLYVLCSSGASHHRRHPGVGGAGGSDPSGRLGGDARDLHH